MITRANLLAEALRLALDHADRVDEALLTAAVVGGAGTSESLSERPDGRVSTLGMAVMCGPCLECGPCNAVPSADNDE